jgi:xanthine dehydrogenase molybdenum-binding subunit
MEKKITFIVNGKKFRLDSIPGETLANLLRKRLRLTGTKIGCNEAECGACTVLVDGEPVMSCIYPAERARGKQVLTIEGLAESHDGGIKLHALQEAFVKYGAVQCGFCIPGQIMTAYALLRRNPNPTQAEIRYALKDTLCRCAAYPSIESAIQGAAHSLRIGEPVSSPQVQESAAGYRIVGRTQVRPDAVVGHWPSQVHR